MRIVHNVLGWIVSGNGLVSSSFGQAVLLALPGRVVANHSLRGFGVVITCAIVSLVSASLGTILILTLIFLECKRCRGGYYESVGGFHRAEGSTKIHIEMLICGTSEPGTSSESQRQNENGDDTEEVKPRFVYL